MNGYGISTISVARRLDLHAASIKKQSSLFCEHDSQWWPTSIVKSVGSVYNVEYSITIL